MKKVPQSKKRTISQSIFVVIIGIFSVITWINNEKKENKQTDSTANSQKSKTSEVQTDATQSTSNLKIPENLGYYDTSLNRDSFGQNKSAPVDYYMLALSWSPEFCEFQARKNNGKVPESLQFQCSNSEQFGWVIHGLWPQNASAKSVEEHPRFCQGDLPPVSEAIIKKYLPESPGAALLQGEWEKHGACAFNTAESYFEKQKALFQSLNLPGHEMSRNELFKWMKKFNPQLQNAYLQARNNELYICYDKSWNVQDCPR